MKLPMICAGILLAADGVLRCSSRRGKLNRTLLGGRIRLEPLENRGMAGGVLKNHTVLARLLSCGALLAVLGLLHREGLLQGEGLCGWGAALLCAGGAGNVIERLLRGCVTDYIRFPGLPGKRMRRLVWNLADLMLLAGTLLLAVGCLSRRT